jgi:hypothetical protein
MRHMRAGIPVPSLRPAAWTTIPGGRRRRAGTLDRQAVIRSARQAVRPSGRPAVRLRTPMPPEADAPGRQTPAAGDRVGSLARARGGTRDIGTRLPIPAHSPGPVPRPVARRRWLGPERLWTATGGSGSGGPERSVRLGRPSADASRLGAVLVAEGPSVASGRRPSIALWPGARLRGGRTGVVGSPPLMTRVRPAIAAATRASVISWCPGPRRSPGEHLERGRPGRPSVG